MKTFIPQGCWDDGSGGWDDGSGGLAEGFFVGSYILPAN